MLEVRHEPTAPTRTLRLASGDKIDAHRHDDHQIVYAGRGVLAVTTDQGSWVAPATRAIWIPAGTFHAHRAYGELKLHTVLAALTTWGIADRVEPLGKRLSRAEIEAQMKETGLDQQMKALGYWPAWQSGERGRKP